MTNHRRPGPDPVEPSCAIPLTPPTVTVTFAAAAGASPATMATPWPPPPPAASDTVIDPSPEPAPSPPMVPALPRFSDSIELVQPLNPSADGQRPTIQRVPSADPAK